MTGGQNLWLGVGTLEGGLWVATGNREEEKESGDEDKKRKGLQVCKLTLYF